MAKMKATVLSAYSYPGPVRVGCCTSRCMDSVTKRCRCMCGGVLHGVGSGALDAAATLDLDALAESMAAKHGSPVTVHLRRKQLELF